MTLLSVIKGVCAVVGVTQPQSVFSGLTGNRTMQEMLELANEMANRIAYDTREWTALRTVKVGGLPGNGMPSYPLPANFKRMLLTSNVWRSGHYTTPLRFIPDLDQWLNRRARNVSGTPGEWTIAAGEIFIDPALQTGEWVQFPYMDKNCILLMPGPGFGEEFMSDGDKFRLDERLLKLGMIWQWKQNKGASYAEDLGTYQDALNNVAGSDSPAPIILGGMPISAATTVAYPWQVPTGYPV